MTPKNEASELSPTREAQAASALLSAGVDAREVLRLMQHTSHPPSRSRNEHRQMEQRSIQSQRDVLRTRIAVMAGDGTQRAQSHRCQGASQ